MLIEQSTTIGHFAAEFAGGIFWLASTATLSLGLIAVVIFFRSRNLLGAWLFVLAMLLTFAVMLHPHSTAKIIQHPPDLSDD